MSGLIQMPHEAARWPGAQRLLLLLFGPAVIWAAAILLLCALYTCAWGGR